MRIALFYHSLISDWNHGNAHFLRGIATELLQRGHDLVIYEPREAWSVENLKAQHGAGALKEYQEFYPKLRSTRYQPAKLDLDKVLEGVDLAVVHEWNEHELVRRIGQYRAKHPRLRLLFHDTHHRLISQPEAMAAYDLQHYDGVLAYGEVLRKMYITQSLTDQAWTWHEAADTRVFHPLPDEEPTHDLVWVGNWGDDERTAELEDYLLGPVAQLKLNAVIHGVRYPEPALARLAELGVDYRGWIPNFRVPRVFARARVTVHVPRRPYTRQLPGIPTIRPFEAMACGIPLISAPWTDAEGLFTVGKDFLMADSPAEMTGLVRAVLNDQNLANDLSENGRKTILARHTCKHRVDELLDIYESIAPTESRLQAA